MPDYAIAIDNVRNLSIRMNHAGDEFTNDLTTSLEETGQGVEWPVVMAGFESTYDQTRQAMLSASGQFGSAAATIGEKLGEVAAAYEHLEQTNALP